MRTVEREPGNCRQRAAAQVEMAGEGEPASRRVHRRLEDDGRRRATSISAAAAATVLPVLRQLATAATQGGVVQLLRDILAASANGERAMRLMRQCVPAHVMTQWQRQVETKRQRLAQGLRPEAGGANTACEAEEWLKKIRRQAGTSVDLTLPGGLEVRSAEEVEVAMAASEATAARGTAIGRLPNAFQGAERVMAEPDEDASVSEWQPARAGLRDNDLTEIPERRDKYAPEQYQQKTQLQKVKGWRLKRLLQPGDDDRFYAMGALSKAINAWRAEGGDGLVPLALLRREVPPRGEQPMPALTASEGGHIWSVREEAPFDAGQCNAVMFPDDPTVGRHIQAMLRERWQVSARMTLTESKIRGMYGMATHQSTVRIGVGRVIERAGGLEELAGRGRPVTIGQAGSGMGLTGLQAAAYTGGQLTWCAEACELTGPFCIELARRMGHAPRLFEQAEAVELAQPMWGATLEFITLRCSPFSPANATFPRDVEPALAELMKVLQGAARRQSKAIIIENTTGLWRCTELRRRYEAIVLLMRAYTAESVKLSPHWHEEASDARRSRVLYVLTRD